MYHTIFLIFSFNLVVRKSLFCIYLPVVTTCEISRHAENYELLRIHCQSNYKKYSHKKTIT